MPTPEISVQLYSIHAALDADLDGSLGKIADIGLRTVEAFDFVRRADDAEGVVRQVRSQRPDRARHPDRGRGRGHPRRPADRAAGRGDLRRRQPARRQDRDRPVRRAGPLGHPGGRAAQRRPAERPRGRRPTRVRAEGRLPQPRSRVHHHRSTAARCSRCSPTCSTRRCSWRSTSTGPTAGGEDPSSCSAGSATACVAVHVKDGPDAPGISARELPSDQQPAGQGDVPLAAVLTADDLSFPYAVLEFDHYEGDVLRRPRAGATPGCRRPWPELALLGTDAPRRSRLAPGQASDTLSPRDRPRRRARRA